MNVLKSLSALLTYPSRELQEAIPEIERILDACGNIPDGARVQLRLLTNSIANGDLYELQERYTDLFDRTRSLSLHIFEHIHGESRDRGQAMVDLQNHYAQHGMEMGTRELPDFIPLFLEFLSLLPPTEASELLGQPINIITALGERLAKRSSPYQGVFQALVSLSSELPERAAVQEIMARPDADADDLEALDAAWEEEEVRFGPGTDAGCKDEITAKVRAGRRPAPGVKVASNKPVIQYSTGGQNA
ncbi:MAG: nitrate reductase molybdenum cofactor assembly chaperone [Xanthobacteraceae bacterium]|nr:nitrate reductase molybdenum cofactor assembly chaperone [Xanthobacteraceae bacterium]QYK44195.1 MAG: nitrate reductase molybdenum cofactor assembly chaperone [Xanthobacteraceae bacterium]